jgi:hypothetical protein
MLVIGAVPRAFAGLSPSEAIGLSKRTRAHDLEKIQKVLEMKIVAERLKNLGFTQEEVQMRLNQLDEDQLHELAQKVDEFRVAGNGAEIVIAIVLVGILVVLVILLLNKKVIVTDT